MFYHAFIFIEEQSETETEDDDYDEQDVDEIFDLDDEPIKRRSDDEDEDVNPLVDSSGSFFIFDFAFESCMKAHPMDSIYIFFSYNNPITILGILRVSKILKG